MEQQFPFVVSSILQVSNEKGSPLYPRSLMRCYKLYPNQRKGVLTLGLGDDAFFLIYELSWIGENDRVD